MVSLGLSLGDVQLCNGGGMNFLSILLMCRIMRLFVGRDI
jgi:hypothetical protein